MENYSPTNYTTGITEQYDTDYLMEEFTDKATDWIEKNSSEPFLIYYAATAVHKPHDYHPRFTGVRSANMAISSKNSIGVWDRFWNNSTG